MGGNYGFAYHCASFQETNETIVTYNALAATRLSSPKIIRHQDEAFFLFMSRNSGDSVM